MYTDGTWLCPDALDRVRFVDMERRTRPVRNAVLALTGLGAVALAFRWGWPVLAIYVSLAALVLVIDRRIAVAARPERWHMLFLVVLTVVAGGSVALTGGGESAFLPWLLIPVVASMAVFGERVVKVMLALVVVTALISTGGSGGWGYIPELMATLVLIACVGLYVNGLVRAEVFHRGESVLDPLTGLLNRATLMQRFEELRQQAALTGEPVALIALDLDHFKHVNDTYGHERGDAVLRGVAYELRKSLRSFELAYRVGGEEFLVILPGLDESAAAVLAEAVCARVRRSRPGGLEVTLSGGVSSAAGDELAYEQLFEQADARLFQAKAEGRDRIVPPSGRRDAAADLRLTG